MGSHSGTLTQTSVFTNISRTKNESYYSSRGRGWEKHADHSQKRLRTGSDAQRVPRKSERTVQGTGRQGVLSSPLRCGCSLCVQQRTPSGQKTLRWDGKEGAWGGCCEGPARPESRESPWGSRMKEGKEAGLLLRGGRQGRFCSW